MSRPLQVQRRDPSVLTESSSVRERERSGLSARLLLGLIALYRTTAAWRAPRCRFLPTCSTFAADAIRVHGPARGSWLAVRRIGRCHPWHAGGLDPVPPPRK